jgi:hypothetical protein
MIDTIDVYFILHSSALNLLLWREWPRSDPKDRGIHMKMKTKNPTRSMKINFFDLQAFLDAAGETNK